MGAEGTRARCTRGTGVHGSGTERERSSSWVGPRGTGAVPLHGAGPLGAGRHQFTGPGVHRFMSLFFRIESL